MKNETLFFRTNEEMFAYFKGPKTFVEPERLEVTDEVSPKPSDKSKPKAHSAKVRKSAKDTD